MTRDEAVVFCACGRRELECDGSRRGCRDARKQVVGSRALADAAEALDDHADAMIPGDARAGGVRMAAEMLRARARALREWADEIEEGR